MECDVESSIYRKIADMDSQPGEILESTEKDEAMERSQEQAQVGSCRETVNGNHNWERQVGAPGLIIPPQHRAVR